MKAISAQQALEILVDVSDVPDLALETEFSTLELDSLMLIEWISELEEKLDAELDIRDLSIRDLGTLSIGDVIAALQKRIVSA